MTKGVEGVVVLRQSVCSGHGSFFFMRLYDGENPSTLVVKCSTY